MFGNLIELFQKFRDWCSSDAVRKALTDVAQLAHTAVPIVAEIGAMVPNRTVQEVISAYNHYGMPLVEDFLTNPAPDAAHVGNELLNLATAVMIKNHVPDAKVSTVNTAVQLALTIIQADKTHPAAVIAA